MVWKKVCAEKGLGGKEKVEWRCSGRRSVLRRAWEGRRWYGDGLEEGLC